MGGLREAVIEQIGGDAEALRDVVRHGADGGVGGFTYYKDTCAFYAENQREIVARLTEEMKDLGEPLIEGVLRWKCMDGVTEEELGRTLWGRAEDHDTTAANGLAWYACESVAREVWPDE